MMDRVRRGSLYLRRHLNQQRLREGLEEVIRNRRGHRPLSANREGGDTVIASYNVHKCVGTDKIFNPARTISVIAELNADVLALQEIDKRFGKRIGLLDLDDLQQKTGLVPVPIDTISPRGQGWHGNALFFREGNVRDVHQIHLPSIEPRGALIVELELRTGHLRIIAAHFGLLRRSRAQQAAAILSFMKERPHMPTIMVGDFNEWRIGKNSSLTTLMPFFDVVMGTVPSFPSRFPVFALDRIFSYPHELVTSVEIHDSPLSRVASDHLPIKAHINLLDARKHLTNKATRAI